MSKCTDLLILDIDGCLVQSFDGKGLNQAAFAEKTKNQPINTKILNYIKAFYESYEYPIEIHVFTGRKKSLLEAATNEQLIDISLYLENINYYPEEFVYDPISVYHDWKKTEIKKLIQAKNPVRAFVLEDDIKLLSQFNLKSIVDIELWLVIKDAYLVKGFQVNSVEALQ